MPRRQMETSPQFMRIELEQQDQDFNYFKLEYAGVKMGANDVHVPVYRITEAGPFQNWLWKDNLLDGTTINLQCRPGILMGDEWKVLNYPVTKIEVGPHAAATKVA